jgi:hypothetical protein
VKYNVIVIKLIAFYKATLFFNLRLNIKSQKMIIRNSKEHNMALSEISLWLKKGKFNQQTFSEIESVIVAVELYMGIPLPAKIFIESNCQL